MKNEKNLNLIATLQYQIQRYQATGNGTMCQLLTAKLRRLTDEATEKRPHVKE